MKTTTFIALFACLSSIGAAGCSHPGEVKRMRTVSSVNTQPAPNESVIVFVRASGSAYAIQASVFDVTESGPPVLVGILAARTKVAYVTTPGPHTFMIVGENADFMEATLQGGRLYHVLAAVGLGSWKARFALKPIRADERAELQGWLRQTSWVETTPSSYRWAEDNSASIDAKRLKYRAEWTQRRAEHRAVLMPEDGQ
jgi:hypothetical protein